MLFLDSNDGFLLLSILPVISIIIILSLAISLFYRKKKINLVLSNSKSSKNNIKYEFPKENYSSISLVILKMTLILIISLSINIIIWIMTSNVSLIIQLSFFESIIVLFIDIKISKRTYNTSFIKNPIIDTIFQLLKKGNTELTYYYSILLAWKGLLEFDYNLIEQWIPIAIESSESMQNQQLKIAAITLLIESKIHFKRFNDWEFYFNEGSTLAFILQDKYYMELFTRFLKDYEENKQ